MCSRKMSVPSEVYYTLDTDSYYGGSVSIHEELVSIFYQDGLIYKHDNKTVYMKKEKESRGASVESAIKEFIVERTGGGHFLL